MVFVSLVVVSIAVNICFFLSFVTFSSYHSCSNMQVGVSPVENVALLEVRFNKVVSADLYNLYDFCMKVYGDYIMLCRDNAVIDVDNCLNDCERNLNE